MVFNYEYCQCHISFVCLISNNHLSNYLRLEESNLYSRWNHTGPSYIYCPLIIKGFFFNLSLGQTLPFHSKQWNAKAQARMSKSQNQKNPFPFLITKLSNIFQHPCILTGGGGECLTSSQWGNVGGSAITTAPSYTLPFPSSSAI